MRALIYLLLAVCLDLAPAAPASAQNAEKLLHNCELTQQRINTDGDAVSLPPGSGSSECRDFMAVTLQYALLTDANGRRLLTACPDSAAKIADAVRAFVDYARAHPEKLNLAAAEVAYEAMKEAFPCKDAPGGTTDARGLKHAEIATSLRLRFDENGKAQEVDRQNLNWYVVETDGPGVRVKAPFYGDCADGEPPFVYKPWLPPPATARSANYLDPGYCLQKSKSLIFVLLFEQPMSFKRISLFAQGTKLPEWDGQLLSKQLAVISIRAGLKNVDLEIMLVN